MHDGTAGGRDLHVDEDSYRDDARAYAPQSGAIPGWAPGAGAGDGPGHGPGPAPGHGPGDGPGDGPGTEPGRIPDPRPGGHRAGPRRRQKSRKHKVVKWVSIIAAVAVLGTAGAAYGYYEYLSGKIRKGERSSGTTSIAKPKANAAGQSVMNILILGSDTRADPKDAALGGAPDSAGARADVIMIAHLSADRSNMSVVSIPRDTRVDIPACTDPKTKHKYGKTNDIINASLGRGGPGCTLAAVQNLTGVYIDHWLMIDFSGVVNMAKVLGGVDVCVRENVWDRPTAAVQHGGSGLKLTKGTHTLTPTQSLQWLRTRDAFGSDAGRAQAQHMYMNSLIRKLRQKNLFTNPAELNKIATAAMSAFEVSSEIGTPKKLYDLGMQLKTIPPDRITMLTMPHIADPQDEQAHYLPAPGQAQQIWSLLRNDVAMDPNGKPKAPTSTSPSTTPTPPKPTGPAAQPSAGIAVTVVNGTAGTDGMAVPGRAGDIAKALNTAGFTQATASQDAEPSPGTTIMYSTSSGDQGKANAIAVGKALKIPATSVKASADVQSVTLTIGADWTKGTDFSTTLPKAGSVPDSADASNGADTTGCMPIQPVYQW